MTAAYIVMGIGFLLLVSAVIVSLGFHRGVKK